MSQWPPWARGLWRRTHRRVSGAARISAELAARGVSVPRGQASRHLAELYGVEAASMQLSAPRRAVLLSALASLPPPDDDVPCDLSDSVVVACPLPSEDKGSRRT